MKVTGSAIMRRIKRLKERADRTLGLFGASLSSTEEEPLKETPGEILARYESLERKIAALQEMQSQYNLQVTVTVGTETLTIEQVAKLKGTVSTLAAKWKLAVETDPSESSAYLRRAYAQAGTVPVAPPIRTLSQEESERLYEAAQDRVAAFSDALMAGNGQSIVFDAEHLFED